MDISTSASGMAAVEAISQTMRKILVCCLANFCALMWTAERIMEFLRTIRLFRNLERGRRFGRGDCGIRGVFRLIAKGEIFSLEMSVRMPAKKSIFSEEPATVVS